MPQVILIERFEFKDGEFVELKFEEAMIEHLAIESKIIIAESDEGRSQVAKFGHPIPLGNFVQ